MHDSDAHSHGTASPAILTPVGTPPISGPSVLGASAGSAYSSSSGHHFSHVHSHLGHSTSHTHQSHSHPHPHSHHQLKTGRWNPFSETRLQQLLSPFDAGSGWNASGSGSLAGNGFGQGRNGRSVGDDVDLEGMVKKMAVNSAGSTAAAEQGSAARFEKRALSQGAAGHAQGQAHARSGLSMTAAPGDAGKMEQGEMKAQSGAEQEGAKGMARRQSMPEGTSTLVIRFTAKCKEGCRRVLAVPI